MKSGNTKKSTRWLKPLIFTVAALGILLAVRFLNMGEIFIEMRIWIESLGRMAPLAYISVYILATVLAVPAAPLTLAAGAVFGSFFGVVYVSVGSTLGAGLSFLIARYFARGMVSGWLSKNAKFKQLDEMSESYGTSIVAITRLIPLFPFNMLNYGFGLTRVRFGTYFFWSWICMLPGTILYVVGVDAVITGLSEGKVPWTLLGILAIVLAILTGIVRSIRNRMKDSHKNHPSQPAFRKDR